MGEEEAKERGAPTPLKEKVTFLFPQTPISIRLSPYLQNERKMYFILEKQLTDIYNLYTLKE